MEINVVARQFLVAHLPEHVKNKIDLESLKLEKESFIEENMKNSIGDVLFSVKSGDRDTYIYIIIEHQSKPDHWMALRLFKYMINICDRYLTLNPKSKKLPLIYPMVFYNGKRQYNAEKNLWNLFEDPACAKEFWTEDHKVINVSEIPDEAFQERPWSGFMEFSMKYIRDPSLLEKWKKMVHFLSNVKVEVGRDYIGMILRYTLTGMAEDDRMSFKKLIQDHLDQEEGEEIMLTAAQAIWLEGAESGVAQGVAKGMAQERENLAIRMLSARVDIKMISRMTTLSISELELLRVKSKKCALVTKSDKK